MSAPLQPILVMMSYRGGERLSRCLKSIERSKHHFKRVLLSVTSAPDSDDMRQCEAFQSRNPGVEVICTGQELPTMQHQAFWIDYLQSTGATQTDWIYWLAYDDEVRVRGIDAITDDDGSWPLEQETVYFGPWAMRHEQPDALWDGDSTQPLESWTSFPIDGPLKLPVLEWIRQQLVQPTYMQMSGSVCPLRNFIDLRNGRPTKKGPMRIEMAVAASGSSMYAGEFTEPLSIIYGRPDSDRATYGSLARREDLHLLALLTRHAGRGLASAVSFARVLSDGSREQFRHRVLCHPPLVEEWRKRGVTAP